MDAAAPHMLDETAQGVLARPPDRTPEGPLKVSGTATYAAETAPEGLATGVLVRAPSLQGPRDGDGRGGACAPCPAS